MDLVGAGRCYDSVWFSFPFQGGASPTSQKKRGAVGSSVLSWEALVLFTSEPRRTLFVLSFLDVFPKQNERPPKNFSALRAPDVWFSEKKAKKHRIGRRLRRSCVLFACLDLIKGSYLVNFLRKWIFSESRFQSGRSSVISVMGNF